MHIIPKLLFLSLLTGMGACTRQEEQPLPVTPKADYMKLHPGNYWIYREYRVTDTGAVDEHVTDSVYVDKDTLIGGKQFHKLVCPSHWTHTAQVRFLRDSLGYIIGPSGTVHFAEQDFTTVFFKGFQTTSQDTIAEITAKMTDRDFATSTPAGIFITSSFTTRYDVFPKYQLPGNEVIHHRTRYAKGVGMVTEVLAVFLAAPDVWERRLVRYHVQ